jgi:ATP-dependent helicase Lhr and Lhr-like helicase
LTQIEQRGASFFADLVRATGTPPREVQDGLWELVAAGLMTADGFENLRLLLDPKHRGGEGRGRFSRPRRAAGRWALVRHAAATATSEQRATAFADQLLARWGVLFRDLLARESLAPPWRDLLVVLRGKEAQGEIRGGRFVSGFSGEQFARPEALDLLRAIRRSTAPMDELPDVANSDPLNLAGIILPGPRVNTLSRGYPPMVDCGDPSSIPSIAGIV